MSWPPPVHVVFLGAGAFGPGCRMVGVVIPETVIIRSVPRPVPDPEAKTAIIKKHFLHYGFNVVDLVHVKILCATPEGLTRTRELALKAMAGDQVAIRDWRVGTAQAPTSLWWERPCLR